MMCHCRLHLSCYNCIIKDVGLRLVFILDVSAVYFHNSAAFTRTTPPPKKEANVKCFNIVNFSFLRTNLLDL